MACNANKLTDYLDQLAGQDPLNAIICPFAGPNGANMGLGVFALLVIGPLGLALTVKTQHPGPIMVAAILSGGLFATALPGIVMKIFALVLMFGIAGVGLYLYNNAQRSL